MDYTALPYRKFDDARHADRELVTVLAQMARSNEPITVRAIIRRMSTLNQASSITRDPWRMDRIAAAELDRIRLLAEGPMSLDDAAAPKVSGNKNVPDIRFLQSFACVARVGNFGHAARELEISQPTLTRQMQALEETFDTRLLIRHGRGTTLTRAGSDLLQRLEMALPLLLPPLDQVQGNDMSPETLSFGVTPEIGGSIVAGIVQQSRARWPDLKLKFDEAPSPVLEEWVIGHRLAFAVLRDPPPLETMYHDVILRDRFCLIASPRQQSAGDASPVRFHDMVHLPLVLPGERHNIRRRLEMASFQHGTRLNVFLETDSLQLTKAVVRSGSAFAVLPSLMVKQDVEQGSLIFRDIEQPTLTTVHSVVASRQRMSPLVAEFIAVVREAIISGMKFGGHIRSELTRQAAAHS